MPQRFFAAAAAAVHSPVVHKCSQTCVACTYDACVVPAVKLAWITACQQVFWGPADLLALWHLGYCHDSGRHLRCACSLMICVLAGSLYSLPSLLAKHCTEPVELFWGTARK